MKEKPNIIFILGDNCRWDCMGFMNHPFIRTPGLDRPEYFENFRKMELANAVVVLGALAQASRLEVFRMLVGSPEGCCSPARN